MGWIKKSVDDTGTDYLYLLTKTDIRDRATNTAGIFSEEPLTDDELNSIVDQFEDSDGLWNQIEVAVGDTLEAIVEDTLRNRKKGA